jgi:hypothetical protein
MQGVVCLSLYGKFANQNGTAAQAFICALSEPVAGLVIGRCPNPSLFEKSEQKLAFSDAKRPRNVKT